MTSYFCISNFFLKKTIYLVSTKILSYEIGSCLGLSMAVNVINYNLNVYYAVILAWSLRYFFASMAPVLPWVSCDNEWNTESCYVYGKNNSLNETAGIVTLNLTNVSSSVQEFWE